MYRMLMPSAACRSRNSSRIWLSVETSKAVVGMSILYISHNLGVVAQIAHEVAVMYLGRIVERASVEILFASPKHPYTRALLRSIPRVDRDSTGLLEVLSGNVPDPYSRPGGCSFHPRCPDRLVGICDQVTPAPRRMDDGAEVSCHLYGECAHG